MMRASRAAARPAALPLTLALALGGFLLGGRAQAVEPVNHSHFGGVAIEGYDPVAYFTEGEAMEGTEEHTYEWQGATWRFASAEHRDLFAGDPERYAPQYGGYCAYAVAHDKTAGIDPEAWSIVDGKLYLNYSKKIRSRWEEDVAGNIARADENWPGLVDED